MEEPEGPRSTGHAEVDAALAALETLGQRPLDEHVAALDAAHSALRALLDAP